jgi:site-specific DNA-methyltransferase (adenine-specific)
MIRHGSSEGDLVLDCFMGSGTTAVVCKKEKINFIGFEIDEGCCANANKRVGVVVPIKHLSFF